MLMLPVVSLILYGHSDQIGPWHHGGNGVVALQVALACSMGLVGTAHLWWWRLSLHGWWVAGGCLHWGWVSLRGWLVHGGQLGMALGWGLAGVRQRQKGGVGLNRGVGLERGVTLHGQGALY